MRISAWSSDVCSSDLQGVALPLLRLPKTNRIALQRGGLFLPRLRRTARRGQGVQAPVGERPRRVLPFLPRLRIADVVGPRTARAPARRLSGGFFRVVLSDARPCVMGRAPPPLAPSSS